MARPKVIIAKRFPDDLVAEYLAGCEVVQGPDDVEWPRDRLMAELADADVLVSWGFNRIDAELLAAGPKLKLVAFLAIGTDNFDRPAMAEAGVWGTNVPGLFAPPAAEIAVGLMIMCLRRMGEAERYLRAGRWTGPIPGRFDSEQVATKQLGLIGCGDIGQRVARAAVGLGMSVVYHTRHRLATADEARLGIEYRVFDELLATSDVVSLHVPLKDDTRHMIDAAALAKMKPGSVLINTARGPVVDEPALVAALQSGHLGGAGLDVFEAEPKVPEALIAMDNVVLMPHIGGGTKQARRGSQEICLADVRRVLDGQEPKHIVVRPG